MRPQTSKPAGVTETPPEPQPNLAKFALHRPTDQPTDRQTGRPVDRMTDLPTARLTDRATDRATDRRTDQAFQ